MDQSLQGCICFAIPPKMFRRLMERLGEPEVMRHLKHTCRLRSLRYEKALEIAAPSKKSRTRKPRRSVYDVGGGEVLPGQLVRSEAGQPCPDEAAEQAFGNTGVALAFFREVLGQNSIDGRGMEIVSAVHYGQGFQNAMWNGQQMIYGDGDDVIGGFTASLDIIVHELSHGVTQHIVPGGLGVTRVPVKEREFKEQKLALKGQAGALNESFSDVCASMVKQWHAKQTVREADWLIGQHILAPTLGRAIRSLKSPGNRRLTWGYDDQIRHFSDYRDGCDVHEASGIANHAFYQVAVKLGGYSWEKAGPIWFAAYHALDAKATFADAAQATLHAAEGRFGAKSLESKAVTAAWRKVGVL